ncbi:FAD-dependent oxidoreductase [Alteromonas sp. C1M14]|uniref:FAD-dependent oxidoreductase n=1 Tax=Alteromonas sp. C1M14 TaxID=2841567 RepID=UPI001C0931F4|nr:FAD-dependent oxidoreductase [Alteromonas sp. C1M14]MBU2980024.1 FAD-dependent oxidoreductase [Alteromonas sp. C1M14]
MSTIAFEFSIPVVIIGGGACGSIAALAAKQRGADVLLLEQDERPMGSTGMSQGLICAGGTQSQAQAGIFDSPDTFYADIMEKTHNLADPVIARTIADNAGATIDWMVESLQLPWELDKRFEPGFGNSTYRVHGWPDHGGQDMVDLLHQRLAEAEIDVLLAAKLTDIHVNENGKVMGISLSRPDGAVEHIGCDSLILACGGFAANREMVNKYMPEASSARNNGHEGSQGTAVSMGLKVSAKLADMGAYQGYGMLTEPQGISIPPNIILNGGVMVNINAERFVDESEDIAGVVLPVVEQPGDHVWVIYDERIEQTATHYAELQELNQLNASKRADSLVELAAMINVPAETLQATFAELYNASDNQRHDILGRLWQGATPPKGRYCALKVVGAIYHTQGGLQVNQHGQVLQEDGTPLPNLFAGGGAARSVSGPAHWGYLPAMGLSTAVTLGRLAGQAAAKYAAENEG